jgi:hypothetical protein
MVEDERLLPRTQLLIPDAFTVQGPVYGPVCCCGGGVPFAMAQRPSGREDSNRVQALTQTLRETWPLA